MYQPMKSANCGPKDGKTVTRKKNCETYTRHSRNKKILKKFQLTKSSKLTLGISIQ